MIHQCEKGECRLNPFQVDLVHLHHPQRSLYQDWPSLNAHPSRPLLEVWCACSSQRSATQASQFYIFSHVVNLPESQFRNSKFPYVHKNCKILLRPFFWSFRTKGFFCPSSFPQLLTVWYYSAFFCWDLVHWTKHLRKWGWGVRKPAAHPPTGVNYSKPRRPQKWEKCSKWADSSQRFLKLIVKQKEKRQPQRDRIEDNIRTWKKDNKKTWMEKEDK